MIDILYEDDSLLALNKPPGAPVQPDKTGDDCLLALAGAHCRQTLYLVHRLDRPVSGIVVFAKNAAAASALQRQFSERTAEKEYLAVVQNPPPKPEDTLTHFVKKNEKTNVSRAYSAPQPGADRAELAYRVCGNSERYMLLHIRLITGRHHQIRAQLAAINCPVKGDVKYGFRRSNPNRSIHLHAWRLAVRHPLRGEVLQLEAPPPVEDAVWAAMKAI